MKKACFLFSCILVFLFCISGCAKPSVQSPLTDQWEKYGELFEENSVTAELIVHDDTEYLQLTFPNGAAAVYRYGLEKITWDLSRMKNGTAALAELKMEIKSGETAAVYIGYEAPLLNLCFPIFQKWCRTEPLSNKPTRKRSLL